MLASASDANMGFSPPFGDGSLSPAPTLQPAPVSRSLGWSYALGLQVRMEPLGKLLVAGRVADEARVELDGPPHHRADVGNELVGHTAAHLVERRFSAASYCLSYFAVITSPPWRARDLLLTLTDNWQLISGFAIAA